MASTTFTEWTCDFCKQAALEDERSQPEGWFGLVMVPQPLHDSREAKAVRFHGCEDCFKSFQQWRNERKREW